ncbi:hypothetical protein F5Y07DRAFT_384638, partial [Xylaria sp. FL0933]
MGAAAARRHRHKEKVRRYFSDLFKAGEAEKEKEGGKKGGKIKEKEEEKGEKKNTFFLFKYIKSSRKGKKNNDDNNDNSDGDKDNTIKNKNNNKNKDEKDNIAYSNNNSVEDSKGSRGSGGGQGHTMQQTLLFSTWGSGRLARALEQHTKRLLGCKINISAWQQLAIATARRHIAGPSFEALKAFQDQAVDLQAGHTTFTAHIGYGRKIGQAPFGSKSQQL